MGRDAELTAVRSLLAAKRLTTLVGPGGCGKTRLALESVTAQPSQDSYLGHADVWWVDLASASAPAQVPETVARSLGHTAPLGVDYVRAAASQLAASEQPLLVLDNAEHLAEPVAHLVGALLERVPQLRILATSREPLRVPGEVVWRVPPLTCPPATEVTRQDLDAFDATRLFLARAYERRTDLHIDNPACQLVARICSRLDGLPLALELAAARVGALSLADIEEGLSDALGLLTAGTRTPRTHHETLHACLRWSIERLTDPERRTFRRLSVFAGPFTARSAQLVCAEPTEERHHRTASLTELVDKSLVQFDPVAGHYRLFEVVKQLAATELAATGELDTTRERHAEWTVLLCDAIGAGTATDDRLQADAQLNDLPIAQAWALASGRRDLVFRMQRGLGCGARRCGPLGDARTGLRRRRRDSRR